MGKFGIRHSAAAKLTPSQVLEIRRRYAETDASQGDLAREFKLSVNQIGKIVRNEAWASVEAAMPTPEQLALQAQRVFEYQESLKQLDEGTRLALAVAEKRKNSPDGMLKELEEIVERDATPEEMRCLRLGVELPPGVRPLANENGGSK